MPPRKSGQIGLVLLIFPFLFLIGLFVKHYLEIDFGLVTYLYDKVNYLDATYGDASVMNWVVRFLLLGGPLIAVFVNLMSVVHARYLKESSEILLSIKVKLVNWLVIGGCSLIFIIFFTYLFVEV